MRQICAALTLMSLFTIPNTSQAQQSKSHSSTEGPAALTSPEPLVRGAQDSRNDAWYLQLLPYEVSLENAGSDFWGSEFFSVSPREWEPPFRSELSSAVHSYEHPAPNRFDGNLPAGQPSNFQESVGVWNSPHDLDSNVPNAATPNAATRNINLPSQHRVNNASFAGSGDPAVVANVAPAGEQTTSDQPLRIQPNRDEFATSIPAVPVLNSQPQDNAAPVVLLVSGESDVIESKSAAETNAPILETESAPKLSVATIEERRKQVEASELSDEIKAAALAQYKQAAEMLRHSEEAVKKGAELRAEREKGPQLIAEIRSQLEQPPERPDPQLPAEASVNELEQLRLADDERLTEARKAFEEWEQRAKVRTDRKPQMPALIDKASQQLADAHKAVQTAPLDGENPALVLARRTEQEVFVMLRQSQLDLYQIEKARYEALNELFPLQRDRLLRTRNLLEKRSEAWKTILLEAGRRETQRQAAEARRKLQDAHPDLRVLAERNTELIQLRKQLQDLLANTDQTLDSIKKTLERVETDFKSVKDKESRAGLTTALGILLRNQRNHLPKAAPYHAYRQHAESEMGRLQLEQMPLEEERDELGDTAALAEEIVAKIDDLRTDKGVDITQMTLSLLNDRKKYLVDLLADYDACIKGLAELDVRSRNLVDIMSEYRNYIDERVLWIRSASMFGLATPQLALNGLGDIAQPDRWKQIGKGLGSVAMNSLPLTSLCFFGLAFLLVLRSRLRNWIRAFGEQTHGSSLVEVLSTFSAILLTLTITSVWPTLMWLVGNQLSTGSGGEFGVAVGESLKTTAIVFWSIEVFRQICRANGIATQYLKWPEQSVRSLHARLFTLMTIGLPLVFGVCLAEHWQDGMWADSLGRILFVSGMLMLAMLMKQILRPNGRILAEVLNRHQKGWLFRTRRVWYSAAVAVPLLLAGMAVAGFQFTAQQLLIRVELTFWLLIVLLVVFTLATHWLMKARRRLAIEQARTRRAAEALEAQSEQSSEDPIPKAEEPRTDFSQLSDQMLKLLRAAACLLFLSSSWFIWGEVLPALQVFDRVELWHTTVQVAEEVPSTEGPSETRIVTRLRAITVSSLLLAVGFLVFTAVASRNIPGLLELSILQRLPLDHGGRNAVTTLSRYAITLSGAVMAARTIGIGWSSVQWLLAALTVGLGFGLQEIFANFVSGLIILFERPVRIGDVVTIDGVSGSVSRIQIRATTITDFDRKEYIVPNKEFVTGRVLNWTLSDKTNRIVITVGVAYGSNTELARNLLVKAATENSTVLDDPAPVASFEGFGDSCLTLLLRCFLPSLENRLKTITELHEAIDREFSENGLEIAFPQRDINVRSVVALPIAMQRAKTENRAQSENVGLANNTSQPEVKDAA